MGGACCWPGPHACLPLLMAVLLPVAYCATYAGPYRFAVLELHTCPNDTEYGPMEDGVFTMAGRIRHNMTIRERVWDGVITLKNKFAHRGQSKHAYNVVNVPARVGALEKFPALPYGHYKATILFHRLQGGSFKKPSACITLVVDILPKIGKGHGG